LIGVNMVRIEYNSPNPTEPPNSRWVTQWVEQLKFEGNLSIAAQAKLFDECEKIADLLSEPDELVAGDIQKGLVVGSVQSGKTGAMLGMTAHALDMGYNYVIVLGGDKTPLTLQTIDRFNCGLFRRGEKKTDGSSTHPLGSFCHGRLTEDHAHFTPRYLSDKTTGQPLPAAWKEYVRDFWTPAVRDSKKVVLIAMKNVNRIEKITATMANWIARHVLAHEENPSFLIIDDEVDAITTGDANAAELIRRIEVIEDIETRICYVGFTATPQATLYSEDSHTMYPDRFIHVLPNSAPKVLFEVDSEAPDNPESEDEDEESKNEDITLINYPAKPPLPGLYCGATVFYELMQTHGNQ